MDTTYRFKCADMPPAFEEIAQRFRDRIAELNRQEIEAIDERCYSAATLYQQQRLGVQWALHQLTR